MVEFWTKFCKVLLVKVGNIKSLYLPIDFVEIVFKNITKIDLIFLQLLLFIDTSHKGWFNVGQFMNKFQSV